MQDQIVAFTTLSDEFNVSERSIRYDLKAIENELSELGLGILSYKKGSVFLTLTGNEQDIFQSISQHHITQEERLNKLAIHTLLIEPINITQYALDQGISRSTAKSDFEKLKLELQKVGIVLNPPAITGEELHIRKFLLHIFRLSRRSLINDILKMSSCSDIEQHIEYGLLEFEDTYARSFNERGFNNVRDYLIIATLRILQGNFLDSPGIVDKKFLESTQEFQLANDFFTPTFFMQDGNIQLNSAEMIMLTNYLVASFDVNASLCTEHNASHVRKQVRIMLEKLGVMFGVEISCSSDEFYTLSNYIITLVYQAHHGFCSTSMDSIIMQENETQAKINDLLLSLEQTLDFTMTKEEVNFLTLSLIQVIDNSQSNRKEKNALLVCTFGIDNCSRIAHELQLFFWVKFAAIIPIFKLKFKLDESIDIIFTTIDIEIDTDIPIIKIKPIISLEDMLELKQHYLMKPLSKKIDLDVFRLSPGPFQ